MFENEVLKTLFGFMDDDVNGECKILQKSSPNIIKQ